MHHITSKLVNDLASKMKIIIIFLFIYFWSIECNFENISKDNDEIILTEIVSNYLYKYFINKDLFLSIVSSLSSLEKMHLHEDISSNLMVHSKLTNFSYSISNGIDEMQPGNMNSFNLILIDKSVSLL